MERVSSCWQTSGTLGKGLWVFWVGTTIQTTVCQEEDKNPEQKEVNTNLPNETERKQVLQ